MDCTDKGVVYSWGDNESGQLARVVSEDDSSASAMLTGMVAGLSQHTIVEIRCGERMSLVLSGMICTACKFYSMLIL